MQKSSVLKVVALCMPILALTACAGHKQVIKSDSVSVEDSVYQQTLISEISIGKWLNDSMTMVIDRIDYYYDTAHVGMPKARTQVKLTRNIKAEVKAESDRTEIVSNKEHKEAVSKTEEKTESEAGKPNRVLGGALVLMLVVAIIIWRVLK